VFEEVVDPDAGSGQHSVGMKPANSREQHIAPSLSIPLPREKLPDIPFFNKTSPTKSSPTNGKKKKKKKNEVGKSKLLRVGTGASRPSPIGGEKGQKRLKLLKN